MPIYEYQCMSCGAVTEEFQKMSDPPMQTCPHCKGEVKKLMSMNTFHLKGNGWYVTDYAKKDSGGAAASPKKTTTDSGSTDTKPAVSSSSTTSTSTD